MNEIENSDRSTRSFGCNGPEHRNEHRCRHHCRSHGYKTGSCSPYTNYQDCVCNKSPHSKSKFRQVSSTS
ncbi:unnamed protein product [Adineta steineri]|uniref:Uncharacterized protein n=1 Tax=Adineta steineri TaxID=433720 RepID=A0A814J889_9BILA|nr:unnamed protein product [Adineta steineri]CAF1067440.1 unnamed protein product [Adineta steineri]CAF3618433.1 unnamed protein product [Adineta steineri]CAF3947614.1 unnamed protein product [Adineta steineri]